MENSQTPESTPVEPASWAPYEPTAVYVPPLPSIGRTVHLQKDGRPHAAVVTDIKHGEEEYEKEIQDEEGQPVTVKARRPFQIVSLFVMYGNATASYKHGVRFSEEPKEGFWNWPPRF